MFALAFFIGIYSYGIFSLGLIGVLTRVNCIIFTVAWAILLLFFERKSLFFIIKRFFSPKFSKKAFKGHILLLFLCILFVLQTGVNFIGALGPELAFDALWYHLTLPRLFLLHHSIYHISGGLLYYSDMPKLGEMLYVGALAIGNEITAKVIHFIFGILVSIVLYKLSRKFFTNFISLLIVLIFYSNLVVDWESITAYIDLMRTFFEVLAIWSFFNWYESRNITWMTITGVLIGLEITTKVLSFGSILVFSLLIFISHLEKIRWKNFFIELFIFWIIALLIPLPWFIFSFIHTGNPVYPFFTHQYTIIPTSFSVISFLIGLWNLFMYSPDPLSPIYLLFFPLIFVFYSSLQKEIKLIVLYCGFNLILWYITPQTGGGRFILPYLPAFSLMCGAIYSQIIKNSRSEWRYISKLLLIAIIIVSVISIGYRAFANKKYLPVIIGKESQQTFLTDNLNFRYGDFYDTDGYFAKQIKPSDTVLLYGFHNLYYVDFPFIDSSWVKKGDSFNYIATQKIALPRKFKNWQLIYENAKTMVYLYKSPKGTCLIKCEY